MTGRHVDPTETVADDPGPDWDAMLGGRRLPETEDEMRVADVVAALRAPGTPEELHGADSTVAALLAAMSAGPADSEVVVPMTPRRAPRTGLVIGSVVALTFAFAGTAAAAATGSLPAPLQRLAASLVGAPAPAGDEGAGQPTAPTHTDTTPSVHPPAPGVTPGAKPGTTPAAPSSGDSSPAAGPAASGRPSTPSTPPGQTVRPSTPPGQTVRPTTPPGLVGRPSAPPGQSHRPTTPPGQSGKPHPTHS